MISSKNIVFTGPESSGKSYLSEKMARLFNLPLVEEFARTYIQKLAREYVKEDLLTIAKKQYELLEEMGQQNKPVISDTDGLTIKIWSQEKYGSVDPGITALIANHKVDHYLLCKPDIPWEFDVQRENEGYRDLLFEIYLTELKKSNTPYSIVKGNFAEREVQAMEIFEKLLPRL